MASGSSLPLRILALDWARGSFGVGITAVKTGCRCATCAPLLPREVPLLRAPAHIMNSPIAIVL